ncbi:hypothetical protein JX265_012517 [Neoarthrinium moseri]|uniref:N-acetyltransferase domain-containing protein n=1 Tax=Neoarthrinium moseri TaxID=1658444 RepID=A0A9Q0AGP3_9PEZI|nr:hypothetical protein JX265_012517 [Neoarthrinium moseri]
MSLPSHGPGAGQQSSIRSFFQPAQPKYAAPPSASRQPPPRAQPPPRELPGLGPGEPQQPRPQSLQQDGAAEAAPSPLRPPPAAPPLPAQATPPSPGPLPTPKPTHHPNVTLSPIHASHVPALRSLTSRLLQVRYPDSFYSSVTDPAASGAFSRVLLWTDNPSPSDPVPPKPQVIGGLVCRRQSSFQARPGSARDVVPNALYLQSLVLQEPYRRLGLAGAMLDEVCSLAAAAEDGEAAARTVCAHVWTENEEGMEWYKARGFKIVEPVVDGFYRQLRPSGAWIMRKEIASGGIIGALKEAAGMNGAPRTEGAEANPRIDTPPVVSFTNTAASPPAAVRGPPKSPALDTPPPGPTRPPLRAASSGSGQSFQNARPETEWNDLPAEMHVPRNTLSVPGSGTNSGASSRSSSAAPRKKRDRSYPAAAFGK